MTDDQAQRQYLYDVCWAIHATPTGRWRAFERTTGEDVGTYDGEPEARRAIKAIDPNGMTRINGDKIIGGPSYEKCLILGIEKCAQFLDLHPGHMAATNALATLQDAAKLRASLKRAGETGAVVNGHCKSRFSVTGPYKPTKRTLR